MEKQSPNNPNNPNNTKRPKNGILVALIITIAIILLISWLYNTISNSQYNATTYSDFLKAMESGQLAEVAFQPDRIIYMTKEEAAKPASSQTACFTGLPAGGDPCSPKHISASPRQDGWKDRCYHSRGSHGRT